MGPEFYVGGRPLSSIAAWGDPTVTHRWPFGSWELTWSMPLEPWKRPPEVVAGAEVYAKVGSHQIWAGNLAEPNWAEGTFAAVGACRQGEGAICFDSGGLTTSVPDVAVDEAIGRGAVDWSRPASISNVALAATEETDDLNYVSALLNAYAQSVGQNWYLDAERSLRIAADPTSPAAMLMPDNGVLGVASETQVGTFFVRYLDSTSHVLETVSYGSGLPEKGGYYGDRGPMSAAAALDIASGVWTPLQAQTGWTNGLTVAAGELLSPGGQPIPLWTFTAGPSGMIRLLGVRDTRGLSANTDVVIAESIWRPSDGELQLNPVGKAARDISSMVEAGGGVLL